MEKRQFVELIILDILVVLWWLVPLGNIAPLLSKIIITIALIAMEIGYLLCHFNEKLEGHMMIKILYYGAMALAVIGLGYWFVTDLL